MCSHRARSSIAFRLSLSNWWTEWRDSSGDDTIEQCLMNVACIFHHISSQSSFLDTIETTRNTSQAFLPTNAPFVITSRPVLRNIVRTFVVSIWSLPVAERWICCMGSAMEMYSLILVVWCTVQNAGSSTTSHAELSVTTLWLFWRRTSLRGELLSPNKIESVPLEFVVWTSLLSKRATRLGFL